MPYPGYVELAEKLNQLTPGAFRQEDGFLLDGRGSDRELGEDRARRNRPHRHHRVLRRRSMGAR